MYPVGFRRGRVTDGARRDWSGQGPRPVVWSMWYPAAPPDAAAPPADAGPAAGGRIFEALPRLAGAPLARLTLARGWPLVLLSHGTGGTAEGMGWLAHGLAAAGFVVIGPDHHGNTASEPYRPEGFYCWWERARDLSVLLDHHLQEGEFAGRLDPGRIYAAGFSMGGHTVLSCLGARLDRARFDAFVQGTRWADGPPEFPDLARRIHDLAEKSEALQASLARQGQDFRDPRIRVGFLMAPAPMIEGFTPESLRGIDLPVTCVTGGADLDAPAAHGADLLARYLPRFQAHEAGAAVGHYAFMNRCTALGHSRAPRICVDPPGVDRAAVHAQALALARDAFAVR